MKHITSKRIIIFVMLQVALYVTFLYLDLNDIRLTLSNYIKYSIIIVCFCYALLPSKSVNKSILFLIRVGLFFTVISDYFLLIEDIYYYGVLTFIVVQLFYGIRIDLSTDTLRTCHKQRIVRGVIFRLLLQLGFTAALCGILLLFHMELDRLLISSVFYFLCILTNTIRACSMAMRTKTEKGNLLFAVGMVLFLLCDINVGLFNLGQFITVQNGLYQTIYQWSSILMWTFYAPSQVLIALSAHQLDYK